MMAADPIVLDGAPTLDDPPAGGAAPPPAGGTAKKAATRKRAAKKAAPRKRAARSKAADVRAELNEARDLPPKNPAGGAPSSDEKLRQAVAQVYVTAGFAVVVIAGQLPRPAGQENTAQADGAVIAANADACAAAWVELSKTNPAIRRWLERLSTTGATGQLIVAHMPIILGIAANHGAQLGPLAMAFAPPATDDSAAA